MRRYQSTLLGASLTALALMIIAVGCSSSNPVAPQTTGIQYENPQYGSGYPYADQEVRGETGTPTNDIEALDKLTPAIHEFVEGETSTPEADRFDNLRIE